MCQLQIGTGHGHLPSTMIKSGADAAANLQNPLKEGIHVILVKGEYMQSNTHFLVEGFHWSREASASHKKQLSP